MQTTLPSLVLSLVLLTGCATSFDEIMLNPYPDRAAKLPSEMVILMERKPDRPYRDIVKYAPTWNSSHEAAIEKMKELAASRGLDGVHTVRCAAPGTVGAWTCDGIGFVYE